MSGSDTTAGGGTDRRADTVGDRDTDRHDGHPRVTRAAVEERLDRVLDPELDRSIVHLQYIDRIDITQTPTDTEQDHTTGGAHVHVAFKLPTAWCSPAFAWMMATDARDEVSAISGVESVRIELLDHLHAEEVNTGVNERLGFADAFPDADGGIESVRHELADKARVARQFGALTALLDAGAEGDWIARLELDALSVTDDEATLQSEGQRVTVPAEPLEEYLEKAEEVGLVTDASDRLFLTPEGRPIPVTEFDTVRRRSRLARTNVEGQGSVCEGLQVARYGEEVLEG